VKTTGRKTKRNPPRPTGPHAPDPVDVVDGIPDRSPNPAAWKYVALIALFLAWLCFLVICKIAGAPR